MRHRMKGRKLSRTASHRKAVLRNMVTSLFEHERIETTTAKAKELRTLAMAPKVLVRGLRWAISRRNSTVCRFFCKG